jgi:hypothetical protein
MKCPQCCTLVLEVPIITVYYKEVPSLLSIGPRETILVNLMAWPTRASESSGIGHYGKRLYWFLSGASELRHERRRNVEYGTLCGGKDCLVVTIVTIGGWWIWVPPWRRRACSHQYPGVECSSNTVCKTSADHRSVECYLNPAEFRRHIEKPGGRSQPAIVVVVVVVGPRL